MAALAGVKDPIRWQENTHQERNAPRWMRFGATLGPILLLALLVYTPLTLLRVDSGTREIGLVGIWILHAAVAVRCIVAGANTVSREHVGLTWDALVLTGVSARRILLGKWLAAIYQVRGWILALGILRLTMLPVFMLAIVNRFVYFYGQYSSYSTSYAGYGEEYTVPFSWLPWASILAVAGTVFLTLLEVGGCTALGMAASSLTRRGVTATAFALAIRFVPVAVFAAFTRYELGGVTYRWYRFMPFAIADGGTSPLYQLAMPLMPWTRGIHEVAPIGLAWVTLLLGSILVISLAVTLIAIRRTGALPARRSAMSTAADLVPAHAFGKA